MLSIIRLVLGLLKRHALQGQPGTNRPLGQHPPPVPAEINPGHVDALQRISDNKPGAYVLTEQRN